MSIERHENYARFQSVFRPPYDDWPEKAFPVFTTSMRFDVSDYATEFSSQNVDEFERLTIAKLDELFLDLGCGRRDKAYENCLYLEVYPSVPADIIVDPSYLYSIRDESFAGIGCFAVLEHTHKPWVVVQEVRRMRKAGGQVFVDWPFLQPVHGYPSHFFNATREGLTSIFQDEGFVVDKAYTGSHQTVAYTVQWVLGALNHNLPPDVRPDFYTMTVGDLIALSPQDERWWRFIGSLTAEAQSELACGNMLVATKSV